MFKKITLSIIGLTLGFGLFFAGPAVSVAHAADYVPTTNLSAQTEQVLVKALDVLQILLNQISARVHSQTNPIQNKVAVSVVLGGLYDTLGTIKSQISLPGGGVAFSGVGSDELAESAVQNNEGAAAADNRQPATLSWFVGPKVLIILIPVFLLIIVSLIFFRPKREELVDKNGTVGDVKTIQT